MRGRSSVAAACAEQADRRMIIYSWNICRSVEAWRELARSGGDLALVQEAVAPPADLDIEVDEASWGDRRSRHRPPWCTAIARLPGRVSMRARRVDRSPRQRGQLVSCRAGTMTVADALRHARWISTVLRSASASVAFSGDHGNHGSPRTRREVLNEAPRPHRPGTTSYRGATEPHEPALPLQRPAPCAVSERVETTRPNERLGRRSRRCYPLRH